MALINPYLNFPGNTEEAFNFYKSVFGGEFSMVVRFKDSPNTGHVAEEHKDKLMHIALPIGKNILMATDVVGDMATGFKQGNNSHISVHTESVEEAQTLFAGLSAGGHVMVPLAMAEWGDYWGWFTDKFGTSWMINFAANHQK